MEQSDHTDGYIFGIELEYRLRLKHDRNKYWDRQKVKDQLARLWNDAGKGLADHITMKSSYAMAKVEDFGTWNIVDEHSMEDVGDSFSFGFEFVSPVFDYKDGIIWATQIRRLSSFIIRHTEPEMDDTTGFHIHVSPVNGRWSLTDLKRIASAVIYFDEPLRTLFPDHKYTEAYLKSSLRDNPSFDSLPPGESAFLRIHDAQTIDELISIINPRKGQELFSQRNYAWNFTNNSEDISVCPTEPKHTVEFRSPRSTTACNLIEQWIIFTVTFLHGCVTSPENIHNDFEPTIDGLNGFLYHNRPPGGTNDYCWEKHLSIDMMTRVSQGVGHYTVDD